VHDEAVKLPTGFWSTTRTSKSCRNSKATRTPSSTAELAELRPLLGLYGDEVTKRLPPGAATAEYVGWRQMYWGRKRAEAPHETVEYTVADRAYIRYGLILDEILGGVDDV
jgi:hypothetical protein